MNADAVRKVAARVITVSWFSAGVSSAVATKLTVPDLDYIIYQHIDDQEADTMRFVKDCEAWFGKPVTIQQSPLRCVENVCLKVRYINGPNGAPCTGVLKKRLRHQWEELQLPCRFRYIWGMDASDRERRRADRIVANQPEAEHVFPLIDRGLTKSNAHYVLQQAGIRRPHMYDLGYGNNNCVGCVKGGKGYWNKVRVGFPEAFAARARLERIIGASCIKDTYLDQLDPSAGKREGPIVPECGAFCDPNEEASR